MIELRRRYSGGVQSPSFSRLPKDYQEVEYLKSTGGQWIETNIPASDGTDIKIDFQFTTYVQGSCLFGAYISNPATRWYMYWRQENEYNFGHGQDKNVLITNPYDKHVVEYITSNKEVKIDGTVVKNFSTTVNTGLSIWIFNCNDNYGGTYPIYAKVFSFYAETSTDRYDLVPCYRTSDYKPGMYDIVNDVFYTNAGEGEFSYGPDVHYNIPPEYQQVEYLESTGTQYMIVNFDSQYHSSGIYNAIGEHMTFGVYSDYGSQSLQLYDYQNDSFTIRIGIAVSNTISPSPKYIQMDAGTGKIIYDDNVIQIEGSLTTDFHFLRGIPLFGRFNTLSIDPKPSIFKRFYVLSLGNIVVDLIPCFRKEDNEAGMYDLVSGEFYTNAGTGTFGVGAEVIG